MQLEDSLRASVLELLKKFKGREVPNSDDANTVENQMHDHAWKYFHAVACKPTNGHFQFLHSRIGLSYHRSCSLFSQSRGSTLPRYRARALTDGFLVCFLETR